MPDQAITEEVALSFEVSLNELRHASWLMRLQTRNRVAFTPVSGIEPTRLQRFTASLRPFAIGLCLGVFHVHAAIVVVAGAAIAFGYWHGISPEALPYLCWGILLIGVIWFRLLSVRFFDHSRLSAACRKRWRGEIPSIFSGPVPASFTLSADRVTANLLDTQVTMPAGQSVKLVETPSSWFLILGDTCLPAAKAKLAAGATEAIRHWALAHGRLFGAVADRDFNLPRRVSAVLGLTLLLFCIWAATHIRPEANAAVQPTSVNLVLSDATTIVAGQMVHLEGLNYTASTWNGALYDRLSGYVSRPDISGAFYIDRSATHYLAQTAEAEFEEEKGYTLAVGKIGAAATMEPLPDSGVFIAWNNPPEANYPGRCGALRYNYDTVPLPGQQVMWGGRLRMQLCSATMSKDEVRDWMLQAIEPMIQMFKRKARGRGKEG
jgi:hypothetical protein